MTDNQISLCEREQPKNIVINGSNLYKKYLKEE